jgi:hypothetical protein
VCLFRHALAAEGATATLQHAKNPSQEGPCKDHSGQVQLVLFLTCLQACSVCCLSLTVSVMLLLLCAGWRELNTIPRHV